MTTVATSRVDDVWEIVKSMTIPELRELNQKMIDEFGIRLEQARVIAQPYQEVTEPEEEKIEFDVRLKSLGQNRINVIIALREVLPLGLREAKDLADIAPVVIKESVTKVEAESIAAKLREAGAEVEII